MQETGHKPSIVAGSFRISAAVLRVEKAKSAGDEHDHGHDDEADDDQSEAPAKGSHVGKLFTKDRAEAKSLTPLLMTASLALLAFLGRAGICIHAAARFPFAETPVQDANVFKAGHTQRHC